MNWNRILSSLLAIMYIVIALVKGGADAVWKTVLFVIFPLACIWFADAMGGFTGLTGTIAITKASPGIIVCILGWLLLLLPIVVGVIGTIAG